MPHSRLKAAALSSFSQSSIIGASLIGHQFSLLTGYEGANQAYAWLTFLAPSVQEGVSPLWNPYSFSGHPFAEEMQNGMFEPVNLLVALWPLNKEGVFSPALYHWLFALTHVLGGFFLFLLIRELGLSFFAGILAGCGFAFGGTLEKSGGWPHLFQSFVWFPLVFFFALRALKARTTRITLINAATAGAGIALAILAGGMYSAILQRILIAAMALFWTFQERDRNWTRCVAVIASAALVTAAGGAAQILTSVSGAAHTLRTLGPAMFPGNEKIPYSYLSDGLWAHSFIGLFLAPMAYGAKLGAGEVANPCMGVIVSALAAIAVWKNWRNLWVRFFAGLTVVIFAYSLGGVSIIHGVLYAFIPRLWMVREPTRGLYLANFTVAVLCAYGADALFSSIPEN